MSNVPAKIPQINSVVLSELVIKYDGAIVAIQEDYNTLMSEVAAAKKNGGITPELDKKMNNMLVSMRLTVEGIYNGRIEYTKPMDEIKSIFTGLESLISRKQKEGMYVNVQKERDEYARYLQAEKQRKDREQEAIINKGKEHAMLKANCESIIRTSAQQATAKWKLTANNILETATLQTIDGVEDTITGLDNLLFNEADVHKTLLSQARLHTQEEVNVIFNEVYTLSMQSDIAQNDYSARYDYLDYIKKSIPGKKAELEKIAAADEVTAAMLKKQADERTANAQSAINFESNQATQNIASEVAAKEQAAVAEALFAADAPTDAPKGIRKAASITVTNVRAFPQIMAMWHRIKGSSIDIDAYAKKINFMITACQKHYFDTGEKIDSPDLIYTEDVKTSARK